ncbi:c-type cytochrome domain-containing protein [Verrucomicrobium spinosum]|uniref:c-type cytochrome domain-containing protein n=1 Tax=Verrucomicrobium spinosum TaxID=2736 RepID=UPI00017450BB|nr:c-type cytochrome domain-containing protein [Verrucomicrobium spinosum]
MPIPRTLFPALLAASAAAPAATYAVDFEKEIKPILKKHCYECHSEEAKKEKAGFVFDNLKRFAKDIGTNLVIEPGKPSASHFYEVIADPGVDNAMPPDGPMPQKDIDKIREWIAAGAAFDPNAPKVAFKKELPPILKWTNAEGRSIKAGFERLEGENVVLKMPDGKYVQYPLSKLSPESQQLARECAAP